MSSSKPVITNVKTRKEERAALQDELDRVSYDPVPTDLTIEDEDDTEDS
jgi:hypothetical protein